jgi:hypothetical protein
MLNRRSIGSALAVVGGSGLVVGVFLTWASVSVDVQAFASALGIDPALVDGLGDKSRSISGLQIGVEARWVLAMGVIVVALALVLLIGAGSPDRIAVGILLAGAVGASFAVYDVAQLVTQKDEAIQEAIHEGAPRFEALGVDTSTLGRAVDLSVGIGIVLCTTGGVLSIVGAGTVLSRDRDRAITADAMTTTRTSVRAGSWGSTRRRNGSENDDPHPDDGAPGSEG